MLLDLAVQPGAMLARLAASTLYLSLPHHQAAAYMHVHALQVSLETSQPSFLVSSFDYITCYCCTVKCLLQQPAPDTAPVHPQLKQRAQRPAFSDRVLIAQAPRRVSPMYIKYDRVMLISIIDNISVNRYHITDQLISQHTRPRRSSLIAMLSCATQA